MKNLNKKGMELTFTTLVGMILALVVLLVLVYIFVDKSGLFGRTINDCESKGGRCVLKDQCGLGGLDICENEGEICCLNLCEDQDGRCKDTCSPGEERIYFGQCGNNEVCCGNT